MKNIQYTLFASALVLMLSACGGDDNNSSGNTSTGTSGSGSNSSGTSGSGTATADSTHRLLRGENADLLATIKKQLLAQYGEVQPPFPIAMPYETTSAPSATADAATAGSTSANTSSTNVQEAGVDEADRLKSDGDYLYAAAVDKPALMVFSADAQATKMAEISLNSSQSYGPLNGFYLQGQKLTALSSATNYGIYPMPMIADIAFAYQTATDTEVFTVDVSNPMQPQQTRKLALGGELVSSRMIGSKLYLATRQAVTLDGMVYPADEAQAAANRAKIDAAQLADFLPDYAVDGIDQGEIFAANDCFKTTYTKENSALSIVSVVTVDTASASSQPQGQCFLGDIETLYASPTALYLATTSYSYNANAQGQITYSGTINTDLHRFNLTNDTVSYGGSGRVEGHLGWYQDLKPFRLSEHNDTLRIITYTGDAVSTGGSSPARLYNLQANATSGELEVIGQLPNTQRPAALGKPGEQVYATRFAGDRGYLVTYRLTDPLYILDLSDPRDPFIVSELEIDGYSDYLHPVGENMLLGVGKDAVADNITSSTNATSEPGVAVSATVEVARGAWYQGVKLSLIDISNPQQPFEKQVLKFGLRGSNTPVSQSHRAFTSLQQGNTLRVAIPLSRHETVNSNNIRDGYNPSSPQFYYDWTQDELLRFDIDISSGVMTQRSSLVSERADSNADYSWSRNWSQDRSVMIGDRVYYLHGDQVLTTAW